jgi:carboxymethylenebutenolidase
MSERVESALPRRAFVGLTAGAATGAGTIATALAQGEGFGKPHPPIVAENDPAIVTATPNLTYLLGGATRTIDSYYAAPVNAGASTPSVVVTQAIWGVDAQLRDVVRRFAKEGYAAIAPDLYTGLNAPDPATTTDFSGFRDAAAKLADDTVDRDLAAGAAYLRGLFSKTKIGVTGFCMGGAIALRQAVDDTGSYSAVSVFYGKVRYSTSASNAGAIPPIALSYADAIVVPLMGNWGEKDQSILAADVRALDAKLGALKKPHDCKVYEEAGHAFFDDTRESYVASAAADAWTRTLGWFGTHLRG